MEELHFIVYSDYLCPWCYNASVRLRRLEREVAGDVVFEWRSFLLRPNPRARAKASAPRDLAAFREYTRSWARPAAEPDSGEFQVWQTDAGPPSHSVPPHLVAKAAARLGSNAFERIHERLLYGYFRENRDISRRQTLSELWSEAGLPSEAFESSADPSLLDETLDQHHAAQDLGVTGVPSVLLAGNDAVIMGAQPIALYRRWIERSLAARNRSGIQA